PSRPSNCLPARTHFGGLSCRRGSRGVATMLPSLPPELDQLLTAARAGSAWALNALFETVRPCLAAQAQGRLPDAFRSRVSGSDVVQETLTAAWTAFPSFAGTTPGEFLAWLLAIQRNAAGRAVERHTAQKRGVGRERPLPAALASSGESPSQE